MRRSTSRIASAYSSTLTWSRGPSSFFRLASFSVTESRMLLCCRNLASRAARSVLPLSPNSFSNTARGFHSIGSACVGRQVHGELERRHLRLLGETPGQQLVHRDVGDNFHFVASTVRRAREKRPGGAGVDVIPVCLDAREHEHLAAVR